DDRPRSVHLGEAVLGTTDLAMGCHVQRRRTRTLSRKPARGAIDDWEGPWAHREHFVLGGPKAHRQCGVRRLEGCDGQDDGPHGVAVLSLYPGLVRTEKVMEAAAWLDLTNSESPEFVGRAVAALAADPDVIRRTGTVQVAAQLATEYGFTDIDGKSPRPLTLA